MLKRKREREAALEAGNDPEDDVEDHSDSDEDAAASDADSQDDGEQAAQAEAITRTSGGLYRNKQRVLVTNAHRSTVAIKFALTGIESLLDSVISSHDYGQPKEEQKFWQRLQQSVGFDPARTLFIDDSEVILQSAQQYGIEHLLCIEQPDSKGESRTSGHFPMINSFEHILSTENL